MPLSASVVVFQSDTLTATDATLSPDGQWLAFSGWTTSGATGTWVTRPGSNAPVALTTGDDVAPTWFPDGRRLTFVRADSLMIIEFDSVSGRARGAASVLVRDAGLVSRAPAVSPDGRQVLYVSTAGGRVRFLVAPVADGAPVSAAEPPGIVTVPVFSRDGRDVLYDMRIPDPSVPTVIPHAIYRAPVTGGPSTVAFGPFARGRIVVRTLDGASERVIEPRDQDVLVLDFRNDTLGRLEARPWTSYRFTYGGTGVIGTQSVITGALQLVSAVGGSVRVLQDSAWVMPVAWTADGRRVLYLLDATKIVSVDVVTGARAVHSVDVPGEGPFELPLDLFGVSPDGRYLLVRRGRRVNPQMQFDQRDVGLHLYDLETHTARQVSTSFARLGDFGTGAGTPIPATGLGDALVYAEHVGDSVAIQTITPAGERRLLRMLATAQAARVLALAAAPGRLALAEVVGDSTTVRVVKAGSPGAGVSRTIPGFVRELRWSPDGRRLAGLRRRPTGDGIATELLLLPVDGLTQLGPLRVVRIGNGGQVHWLPDSRAVLLQRSRLGGTLAEVLRVPVDEAVPAEVITKAALGRFESYLPSPDGRWLALWLERANGSAVYRTDFPH